MTTRLLPTLGLATLLTIFAGSTTTTTTTTTRADDKPQVKGVTAGDLMHQANEAYKKDDVKGAIKLLEQSLVIEPDFRNGLYLLANLALGEVDEIKDVPAKVAMLRKATSAFDRLKARYKDLSKSEQLFAERVRLLEPRALSLEGKADASLTLIKGLLANGFDDYEALEKDEDLAAVRKLPTFQSVLAQGVQANVTRDLAAFQSFPFDFKLKGVDDKLVKLADSQGKVMIVDIWGTWCPPCREEVPSFVDLDKAYRLKGLSIIGINCNEEGSEDEIKKTIQDFATRNKMTYKCVLNDENDKIEAKVPKFRGYPTTLFLDRSGKVRMVTVGGVPKIHLETIVTTLLAEPLQK